MLRNNATVTFSCYHWYHRRWLSALFADFLAQSWKDCHILLYCQSFLHYCWCFISSPHSSSFSYLWTCVSLCFNCNASFLLCEPNDAARSVFIDCRNVMSSWFYVFWIFGQNRNCLAEFIFWLLKLTMYMCWWTLAYCKFFLEFGIFWNCAIIFSHAFSQ